LDIGADYTPISVDGSADDYHCFVVDPGVTEDRFLIGHQVQPGNADLVHHVLVYQPINDQTEHEAVALDAAAEGPGYTCFGDAGVDASIMAAWAPGVGATIHPAGTGLRVVAGRKLVIQVHYHLDGSNGSDRTTIALDLADSVTNEVFIEGMFHDGFSLEPGQERVESVHSHLARVTGIGTAKIWGTLPHMHTLGIALNVQVAGDDRSICLVDVPRWDFNWQGFYFYDEPVQVDGDDRITITCAWSTQGRTEQVIWGDGTEDEMCLAFFYTTRDE
jgi:hypothetical protein